MNNDRLEVVKKNNQKVKRMNIIFIVIAVVIVLFGALLTLYIGQEFKSLVYSVIIVVLFFLFIIWRSEKLHNLNNVRTALMATSIQDSNTNVELSNKVGISKDIIFSTGLAPLAGDSFKSYGYITSQYKGMYVEQAIVDINMHTMGNDDNGSSTIFSGKWMIFDFNRPFKTNIRLINRSSIYATIDNGINSLSIGLFVPKEELENQKKQKYKKVDFDDIYLKKSFKAYVKEIDGAVAMLDNAGYESLKKIHAGINGRLSIGFLDNKLHIAIADNKDIFKMNFFGKANPVLAEEQFQKETLAINRFIDEINANPNMFK